MLKEFCFAMGRLPGWRRAENYRLKPSKIPAMRPLFLRPQTPIQAVVMTCLFDVGFGLAGAVGIGLAPMKKTPLCET
ncbi:MAG: hypothetical protein AB7O63_08260 [Reyranellaceae bacterium]